MNWKGKLTKPAFLIGEQPPSGDARAKASRYRRLGQMSTTYLTSTLTGLLKAPAILRWPSQWQRSTGVLLAFVAGALLGGLATLRVPAAVPAAILIPITAVLTAAIPAAVLRAAGG